MTDEKRLSLLHKKMHARYQKKERRKTALIGSAGSVMFACVFAFIVTMGGTHQVSSTMYSGATLLFEDVGGYVLMAIVAFMAGVCVTVACIRINKHIKDSKDDTGSDESSTEERGHDAA